MQKAIKPMHYDTLNYEHQSKKKNKDKKNVNYNSQIKKWLT